MVRMTGPRRSTTPIDTTFEYVNEPSVIRYTTDGSKPTESSPLWDSTGPREPGQVFHITRRRSGGSRRTSRATSRGGQRRFEIKKREGR